MTQKSDSDSSTVKEPEDKWMVRECQVYKDEYKECTSFKGRFQQYFVYGELLDCNQWKKDYNSCCKWKDKEDIKAVEALIESEKARRMARLRAHYANTTWKKREAPPADWDRPLPDWMVERDKNTYLAFKSKEYKGETEKTQDYVDSLCSIM